MAFVRGNTVFFTDITFTNQEDEVVEVDTATLTLRYPDGMCFIEDSVDLTLGDDDTYSGSWESGVSDAGYVTWTLKGESEDITVVRDGKFRLTWNRANEGTT